MPTYFLAGELDALRAEYAESLDRIGTVSTPGSHSTDEYGNTTNTPTTQTNVAYAFMAAAGNERLVGGGLAQVGNYILRFKAGTGAPTLNAKQTVTDSSSGKTFQLAAPLDHGTPVGQRWLATEG